MKNLLWLLGVVLQVVGELFSDETDQSSTKTFGGAPSSSDYAHPNWDQYWK